MMMVLVVFGILVVVFFSCPIAWMASTPEGQSLSPVPSIYVLH
jgi:hypothetical protein